MDTSLSPAAIIVGMLLFLLLWFLLWPFLVRLGDVIYGLVIWYNEQVEHFLRWCEEYAENALDSWRYKE